MATLRVVLMLLQKSLLLVRIEKQAKEKGYELKIGKSRSQLLEKLQASGAPDGFVKVIFDAKYGEWFSCHIIGAGVTDMIAEAVSLETRNLQVTKSSNQSTRTQQ